MIELHEIHLQDYVLYKDLQFEIMNGTSVLRGKNRSGKSLVFSPLLPLLFNVDKLPAGSKVDLTGVNNGTPFTLTGFNHGKSDRFNLVIDGVDQQTDTIAKARAVIDKFFGISESVFNTTVHISGLKDHPLAAGKPSDRLDWIHRTLAFSEVFDSYAAIVEANIKQVRDLALKHNILVEELEKLDADKPEKPNKQEEVDTGDLRAEIDSLYRRADALADQQSLPERPKTKMSLAEVEKAVEKAKNKLAALKEEEKAFNFYEAELKHYKRAQSNNESAMKLVAKLRAKIGIPENISDKAALKGCKKRLASMKEKIEEAKAANALYDEQEELRSYKTKKTELPTGDLKHHFKKVDAVPKTKKAYDAALAYFAEDISNAKVMMKLSDGDCTYCGKDLAKNLPVWEATLSELKQAEKLVKYNWLVIQARDADFAEQVDLDDLNERKALLEELIDALGEVELVDKPKSVQYDAETHEEMREYYAKLKQLQESLEDYEKRVESLGELLPPEELRAEIKKVRSLIAKKQEKLTNITESQVAYATQAALWKKYRSQREKLTEQIAKLSKYPARSKVNLALRAAFGRDGLRVQRLNETLELFVERLNASTNFIFNEPFKFDIEVGHRRCDVIAYRNGKKGSIFTASGSERRGWQLVCAMALLQILPNSMRFDTIILDELEANMDDISKQKFVKDYLPELQKLVPNIVLVTPLSEKELHVPAAYHYMAVKNKTSSKLVRQ